MVKKIDTAATKFGRGSGEATFKFFAIDFDLDQIEFFNERPFRGLESKDEKRRKFQKSEVCEMSLHRRRRDDFPDEYQIEFLVKDIKCPKITCENVYDAEVWFARLSLWWKYGIEQ